MTKADLLSDRLAACVARAPDWVPVYDEFIARLRILGVGSAAPAVNELFPPLILPDHRGRYRSIDALIAKGPTVIIFQRGIWCPYCTEEVESWGRAMPALLDAGGQFIAITPEVGGRATALLDTLGHDATVLCDIDHGASLAIGLAFHCGFELFRELLFTHVGKLDI